MRYGKRIPVLLVEVFGWARPVGRNHRQSHCHRLHVRPSPALPATREHKAPGRTVQPRQRLGGNVLINHVDGRQIILPEAQSRRHLAHTVGEIVVRVKCVGEQVEFDRRIVAVGTIIMVISCTCLITRSTAAAPTRTLALHCRITLVVAAGRWAPPRKLRQESLNEDIPPLSLFPLEHAQEPKRTERRPHTRLTSVGPTQRNLASDRHQLVFASCAHSKRADGQRERREACGIEKHAVDRLCHFEYLRTNDTAICKCLNVEIGGNPHLVHGVAPLHPSLCDSVSLKHGPANRVCGSIHGTERSLVHRRPPRTGLAVADGDQRLRGIEGPLPHHADKKIAHAARKASHIVSAERVAMLRNAEGQTVPQGERKRRCLGAVSAAAEERRHPRQQKRKRHRGKPGGPRVHRHHVTHSGGRRWRWGLGRRERVGAQCRIRA
eukprot:Opistho-2@25476